MVCFTANFFKHKEKQVTGRTYLQLSPFNAQVTGKTYLQLPPFNAKVTGKTYLQLSPFNANITGKTYLKLSPFNAQKSVGRMPPKECYGELLHSTTAV